MTVSKTLLSLFIVLLLSLNTAFAQSGIMGAEAAGKWDITLQTPNGELPSWLEIETSGNQALIGQFVGPAGSARPISEINFSNGTYSFTIPPQWTPYDEDPHFEFELNGDKLEGWTTGPNGNKLEWTAVRAPSLDREEEPVWGEPINLLDENLSKWELAENNQFQMKDRILVNQKSGGNLVTKQKFSDFKLHVEFRYPEGSNSGVYLRGRYEAQIADNYGEEPESHYIGGIYGFIDPTVNAAKKAGEWQSYDITLTGRMVTVVLNGTEVICNRPIPGITGGALDSNEGEPGPIMLQGDHGPIEFRNITITPATNVSM
ncbi:DUF1080 domain-containing protein [Aliifodinibius sp. S!AR15-10]|uniref:3-keto-disaccharide hydrolase n=1 Tax=Aliifodinibius sp. S!AR15-10 TaxID=2950437 RepID=UPI002859BCCF|nr:DUF1080 domain-containing protein [Aliifodinibius sp. S!AR15-10]MDR8392126.1 DUF1080 domain-containing protein [Aliifodinibius sp. S!AR15-10]